MRDASTRRRATIGARDLGCNLTVLPPGKVQRPFHSHHVDYYDREPK